jgi:hypothetical protein
VMTFGQGVIPNCSMTCIRSDAERFGAESQPIWKPSRPQPLSKGVAVVGGSVAETLFGEGPCLPSGTLLSTSVQNRIIETVLATAP